MELHPILDFGEIPIYNIMGGAGFIIGLLVFIHNIKSYDIHFKRKDQLQLLVGLSFLSGLFFANFLNWFAFPHILELPILLRFKYAGFSFYFGLIGFIFTSVLLLKTFKFKVTTSLNYTIPSLLIFHSLGRVGCSLAGCCYGKVIDYNLFNLFTIHRFPAREIEAISLFIMFLLVQYVIKKKRIVFYLYSYPIIRFLLEFGRGDDRGELFVSFLSPSQQVSLAIIFLTTIYLLIKKYYSKQKKTNPNYN